MCGISPFLFLPLNDWVTEQMWTERGPAFNGFPDDLALLFHS